MNFDHIFEITYLTKNFRDLLSLKECANYLHGYRNVKYHEIISIFASEEI